MTPNRQAGKRASRQEGKQASRQACRQASMHTPRKLKGARLTRHEPLDSRATRAKALLEKMLPAMWINFRQHLRRSPKDHLDKMSWTESTGQP